MVTLCENRFKLGYWVGGMAVTVPAETPDMTPSQSLQYWPVLHPFTLVIDLQRIYFVRNWLVRCVNSSMLVLLSQLFSGWLMGGYTSWLSCFLVKSLGLCGASLIGGALSCLARREGTRSGRWTTSFFYMDPLTGIGEHLRYWWFSYLAPMLVPFKYSNWLYCAI